MRRFKEPLKTLLILLLTASAVFLAWKGSLFSAFFPARPGEITPTPESQEQSYTASALPSAAAVRFPGGLCCGVQYDEAAMEELYERVSAVLSEALGSAEAPESISRFTWQDRLKEESLYLDYGFDLPISALAAWVGVEAAWAGAETGSAYLLDDDGSGSIRLSYRGGNGRFFQCLTAASWASLRETLEDYRPNGAFFAYELPVLDACEPYVLVPERLPALHRAAASAEPGAAGAFAELFGVNLGGQSRYAEADGTLVYPGDGGVLRLGSDGSVSCAPAEGAFTAHTPADQIEMTRKLLETVHAAYAGEERLSLCAFETTETGETSLRFAYLLGGVRVELSGGPAAEAIWREGQLTELRLRPRSYRRSEEFSDLLPAKQASAAAGSLQPGARAELILPDGGEERLEPVWIVTLNGRKQWTQED